MADLLTFIAWLTFWLTLFAAVAGVARALR